MGFRFSLNPTYAPVMPAHSRSQNGVALLAYVASLHVLRRRTKSWMAGTSPAITAREFCAGKRENISSSTRRRIVAVLVTYRFKSRLIGRGPDACRVAGRGRCPRADLQPARGRLWASTQHYDRGARCIAGTSGQAGTGNAHSTDRPRPREHGLRLSRGRLRVPLARTAVERR